MDIPSETENLFSARNLIQILFGKMFSLSQLVPVIDPELTKVSMFVWKAMSSYKEVSSLTV